jgi:hypothetical protein
MAFFGIGIGHWAWSGFGLSGEEGFSYLLVLHHESFELRQLYSLSNFISEMQYDFHVTVISQSICLDQRTLLTMLSIIRHVGRSWITAIMR